MKIKTAVAILLVAIFALSSIAIIRIEPVKAAGIVALSDAELYNEFLWKYAAPSSLTGKIDVAGPGVQFDIANLAPKAGIEDIFPVSSLAGGSDYYGHPSDFTGYDKYSMLFVNVGSSTFDISLYMNTGFTNTGDWGTRDYRYDTFWKSNTITLAPHESGVLTLDFSNVYEAWNIDDDPVYTGYSNGVQPPGTHIFRLNEVTSFGFEVYGSGSASVIASGTLTHLYIDPPAVNRAFGDVGTSFTEDVTLSDFANLAGFDIKLTWDESLITETGVAYTADLDTLWGVGKYSVLEYSSAGYYELVAVALAVSASNPGASVLFTLTFQVKNKDSNVPLSTPITFDIHKLSDNAKPIPNPITATVTGGKYTYQGNTIPDLEFKVKRKNRLTGDYEDVVSPYIFEYCRWVEVEVYATHIKDNSPLTAYNLIIQYTPESLRFDKVDYWGAFGTGSAVDSPTGTITVSCAGGPRSGDEFLLFALTFHVEFSNVPAHIWKNGHTNYLTSSISISDATLTFGSQGTIPMSGISTPLALTFEVDFIRGDVDCNGVVNFFDIGDVASNYGKTAPPEYDLTNDGIIDIYDLVAIGTNFGYPTGVA